MAEPQPIPLKLRIDLGEAFVELIWEGIKALPKPRGFDSAKVIAEQRAAEMAKIDKMLEELLGFYDQRILEAAS